MFASVFLPWKIFIPVTILYLLDVRMDKCYLNYEKNQCANEISGTFNKSVCCCTIGKAFANTCEPCPLRNSDDYTHLCGLGSHSEVDGAQTGYWTDDFYEVLISLLIAFCFKIITNVFWYLIFVRTGSVVTLSVASNVFATKAMMSMTKASTARILTNAKCHLKYVATESVRTRSGALSAHVQMGTKKQTWRKRVKVVPLVFCLAKMVIK